MDVAVKKKSLWAYGLPMSYEGGAIFDAGFRAAKPNFEVIKKGEKNPRYFKQCGERFCFLGGVLRDARWRRGAFQGG